MPISVADFDNMISTVFPGAVQDAIGKHTLFPRHTFRAVGRTNHLDVSWEHRGHEEIVAGIATDDDLIGWLSWVRGEIMSPFVSALASHIRPSNLFPEGLGQAALKLPPALNTLRACGFSRSRLVDVVAAYLAPDVGWIESVGGGVARAMFKVKSAGGGTAVGRCEVIGSHATLRLELSIPVTPRWLNAGGCHHLEWQRGPDDDEPISILKKHVLRFFVEKMLDRIIGEIEAASPGVDV